MIFKTVSLLLFFCYSSLPGKEERGKLDRVLEEIQGDLEDLKHSLHSTQVDLSLFEGKVKNQLSSKEKGQNDLLERRIALLEKRQEKIQVDLQTLSSHLNDAIVKISLESEKVHTVEKMVSNQKQYAEEMSKLKETLLTLIKTMRDPSLPSPKKGDSLKTYKVKNGDSLEKIARMHQTTVEELKKTNQLKDDRIFIEQELHLP